MKRILFVVLTLCSIGAVNAQSFGYYYGSGRSDVQFQTPIAAPGAGRPEAVWAVSGNLNPFNSNQPAENSIYPQTEDASRAGRRKPPTTGGGNPENPDLLYPLGELDIWCGLFLGLYTLVITIRQYKSRKTTDKHTPCGSSARGVKITV